VTSAPVVVTGYQRVAVLDDYQRVAERMADWSSLGPEVRTDFFHDHVEDQDALAARLAAYDVVVLMRERTAVGAPLLARLPALRLIVTTGMGNAALDVAAASAQGVVVCGTTGSSTSTAELAFGLVLSLMRGIAREERALRAGEWQVGLGTELAGSTLGLLGLGRLGGRMAALATAFDMRVLAWSQHLTAERAAEAGAELVAKEELLERSDAVSVHLVLSDRTRGLLGAAELARMRPSAYLVNTSRGPVVDETALVEALRKGALAGAALDVYDREPLPPDSPLRSAPRLLLTPHIGYVTDQVYRQWFGQVVEDIAAFRAGVPVRVLT
jgi:phosphoglycerate dehydrogenase-like enzyme